VTAEPGDAEKFIVDQALDGKDMAAGADPGFDPVARRGLGARIGHLGHLLQRVRIPAEQPLEMDGIPGGQQP